VSWEAETVKWTLPHFLWAELAGKITFESGQLPQGFYDSGFASLEARFYSSCLTSEFHG
jgi:hypothetical protein